VSTPFRSTTLPQSGFLADREAPFIDPHFLAHGFSQVDAKDVGEPDEVLQDVSYFGLDLGRGA
jgi:hypothetical protein